MARSHRMYGSEGLLPLLMMLAGCATGVSKAAPSAVEVEKPTKLDTTTVAERPMPRFLTLTGTMTANRSSQVAADGVGRVRETFVERGVVVKVGALLIQLDSRSARLSESEAHAQVEALRSQHSAAQRECERAERLLRDRVIGQAEYDRLRAQCSSSEWSSQAASVRAELATKNLADAAVRAPFAGMVVERFVSVGEYVRPGTTIAALVELDPLRLQLTVPESEISRVRIGQTVSFDVTAFAGERFEGKLDRLSPSLRQGTRDMVVEAIVGNPDHKLLPGMFAVARIETEREPRPVVPAAAVRGEGTRSRVFVIAQGRLEERLVQLGEREGDLFSVEKGLRKGDRIASIAAGEALHDGLLVE
jgi:membrane fusion protein, multidrug efflux system